MATEYEDPQVTEVEEVLRYDFFRDEPEEPIQEDVASGEEEVSSAVSENSSEGAEVETAAEGSEEPAAEQPSTPAQAESPELALLRQQNQMLQGQLSQLVGLMQQARAPEKSSPPQEPEFVPQIPAEVGELLDSEDPRDRLKALQLAITSAGQQVLQHVQGQQGKLAQVLPHQMQQMLAAHEAQQQVNRDFYTAHPDLANPDLVGIVQQIGREVATLRGAQSWSPELRDEIARTVRQRLNFPTPKKQTTAPKAPAMVGKSGARSTPKPSTQADQASQVLEIMDFL